MTNLPADWKQYRTVRNKASEMAKKDNKETLENKLNSNDRWKTTKQLTGT